MALVTSSIGATARDYTSPAAWEAASYGATGSDDALGEVYDDADIPAENVTFNDVTPLSIELRSAVSDRHTGGKNTGATLLANAGSASGDNWDIRANGIDFTMEWLEFDCSSTGYTYMVNVPEADNLVFAHNLLYDFACSRSGSNPRYMRSSFRFGIGTSRRIHNNILADASYSVSSATTLYGMDFGTSVTSEDPLEVYNNTIAGVAHTNGTSGDAVGIINLDQSDHTYTNNLVYSVTSTAGTATDWIWAGSTNITANYNLSEDATADDGPNSGNDVVSASVTFANAGAGDYRLVSGDAVGAGQDLGAVAWSVDINGRDRDSQGDTWDIGAHQTVPAGGGYTAQQFNSTAISSGGMQKLTGGLQ